MNNTDTGGPAFPGLHPSAECRFKEEGMTLRDYFAAKAMEGLLLNNDFPLATGVPEKAYKLADAMLKARKE